ncbi:hypothetical protein [Alicyclobacillus sp. SP_1]|jgi:hypothetical protein|uniref:hypothetical protein n=1 Tax=Alicyclobacillus sp. SP_1 TaxID=2942475 RepID=UPI002157AF6F|nr:hypothetical protein [Alicyclobacillus sp. SP_1]
MASKRVIAMTKDTKAAKKVERFYTKKGVLCWTRRNPDGTYVLLAGVPEAVRLAKDVVAHL